MSSLVYKNIYIYRILLNIIYQGRYKSRFSAITPLLQGSHSVTELCFGDIHIAKFCNENHINWIGYDLNNSFVKFAQKHGYAALYSDILKLESLPKSDIVLVQGSLYHFHQDIEALFSLIFASTNTLIISEPIKNLSSSKGLIGILARRSANTGKGEEPFRYTEATIIKMLDSIKRDFKIDYRIISKDRDIILLINRVLQ